MIYPLIEVPLLGTLAMWSGFPGAELMYERVLRARATVRTLWLSL